MSTKLTQDVASAAPNLAPKLDMAENALQSGHAAEVSETDILNFALNLEYLEAEFYTFATTGKSITDFGIGIDGIATGANPAKGGSTLGGALINFDNNGLFSREIATEIGVDERAHVILLRNALGSAAVAKPNINLNALGTGFGNQTDFLVVARLLEDAGVSAYAGAAGMLKTPAIISTAARLLAAEALHSGSIRTQVASLKIATSPVDTADLNPPPSGKSTQFLSVNPTNGLTAARSAGEILYLTFGMAADVTEGGFFPNGLNGKIRKSSSAATEASLA